MLRNYDLTPEQYATVRHRLIELQDEHRAYTKKVQATRISILKESLTRPQQRDDQGRLTLQAPDLVAKMQAIYAEDPTSPARVHSEIESFLSPEQIQAAHLSKRFSAEKLQSLSSLSFGSWEVYVATFVKVFNLDSSQRATAFSILREMESRRNEFQRQHQADFDATRSISNKEERFARP